MKEEVWLPWCRCRVRSMLRSRRYRVVKERAMNDPSYFARLAAAAVDALSLQDPVDRDEVLSDDGYTPAFRSTVAPISLPPVCRDTVLFGGLCEGSDRPVPQLHNVAYNGSTGYAP